MTKFKRTIALLMTLAMMMSIPVGASPSSDTVEAEEATASTVATSFLLGMADETETVEVETVETEESTDTSFSQSFQDVSPDHWAYEAIEAMVAKGYIAGTSGSIEDGTAIFDPSGTVTTEQFCVMLARAFYGTELGEELAKDRAENWWEPYFVTLINSGDLKSSLMVGSNTYFSLSDETLANVDWQSKFSSYLGEISRKNMVYIISSIIKNNAGASTTAAETKILLANMTDIDTGNTNYGICFKLGILAGKTETTFCPDDTLTRAEAAVILYRLCEATDELGNQILQEDPQYGEAEASTLAEGQYSPSLYTVPADTNKDGFVTQDELDAAFAALEAEYPTWTAWGDDKKYTSTTVGVGSGCAAWAKFCWDEIWGNLPISTISDEVDDFDVYDIQAGDMIWDTQLPHWWIVTDINVWEDDTLGDLLYAHTSEGNVGASVFWGAEWWLNDSVSERIAAGTLIVYSSDVASS